MPRIEALEIDDHILDKIESKHGVEFFEVEEACYSDERHIRRGREGLYQLFGQTDDGRYLFVVLADRGSGVWKVATARAMTERERRLYWQVRGK
ncbi:MAG: BrnT family toxin [Dehalococcoidia bacterium]